jgi:hypothetical protein
MVGESATARLQLPTVDSLLAKAGREFSKADSVFPQAGEKLFLENGGFLGQAARSLIYGR